MSGQNCRLIGGGVVSGDRHETGPRSHHSGLITLEDLESFTDDLDSDLAPNGSDSPEEDSTEVVEFGEPDQLLNYWQNIGRGHSVNIPRDMAAPIQQLTLDMDSNPERERVPFTLLKHLHKVEKRRYEAALWACVCMSEATYEQSICTGFMKIMRFICQQNSSGAYLGMTIPIVTLVQTDPARMSLAREVTVAYYIPTQHQAQPPSPLDPDISIQMWPSAVVYSREFSGITNETAILEQIQTLASALDSSGLSLNISTSFLVAGYTSLAASHRHNEIWFVDRGEI